MVRLLFVSLVLVACGGGSREDFESEDNDSDLDERLFAGSGSAGRDHLASLRDGGSADQDASSDENVLEDGGVAGSSAAGSGASGTVSEAGMGGGAGTGEAGAGEAGTGEAGTGEAGAAGEAGAGGSAAFVPTREMFIGDWSWQRENVPILECPALEVVDMEIEAEDAAYDCTASGCSGETEVASSYEFNPGFGFAGVGPLDHWEGETWVGTSLTITIGTPYDQTHMFWLVDENTVFGFSRPDMFGAAYGVQFCELFKLIRL